MNLCDYVKLLSANDRQSINAFIKSLGADEAIFSELQEFKIKLEGDRFHGTVSADFAQSLWKLQTAFYRFVALVLHDDPSATLSTKEKERYLLVFKINEGSTDAVSIGFSDSLLQLASNMVSKMEGLDMVLITLFIAAAYTGAKIYTAYKAHESKKSSEAIELEKRKLELNADTERFTKLLDTVRDLTDAASKAGEDGSIAIVKGVSGLKKASIGERNFSSEDIVQIKRAKSQIPDPQTVYGKYFVFDICTKDIPMLKLQLQEVGIDQTVFSATLDISADDEEPLFSDEQIEALRRSHWNGTPLNMKISRAVLSNGKIRNAVVNDIILDEMDR